MWVVWFSEPLWMREWHSVASTRGQCLGWLRIHDLVPLLVFNVEESEVTLSFVPLKVTSFCCLDAFIFFSLAFTFEIQILAFSKAERGHVWTEKSWCSLFPVKHYGEMRWKFKLSHVTKSQPEGSPSTERLSLSVSWSGWNSTMANSHPLKVDFGFGNSQRKFGAKFCWEEWGERYTFWLE